MDNTDSTWGDSEKYKKSIDFFKKICVCQKKAVPLQTEMTDILSGMPIS